MKKFEIINSGGRCTVCHTKADDNIKLIFHHLGMGSANLVWLCPKCSNDLKELMLNESVSVITD